MVLKNLMGIYPLQKEELKTEENQGERNQLSNRTKLILDHINHLLESLLALLPAMNKKYLKLIFEDIIVNSTAEHHRNELRLYLLRFGEKILQVCGADLEIPVEYIRHVFLVSEGRFNFKEASSKHINHNLTYFSQRILELLKLKILKNYRKSTCLRGICSWVHETLINLCENEAISANAQLSHILDLIISIYTTTRLPLAYPV